MSNHERFCVDPTCMPPLWVVAFTRTRLMLLLESTAERAATLLSLDPTLPSSHMPAPTRAFYPLTPFNHPAPSRYSHSTKHMSQCCHLFAHNTHTARTHTVPLAVHGAVWTQVLGLYRSMLRAVNNKPEDGRQVWRDHIRAEFDKSKGLSRGDVSTIENRLRIGSRQ